MYVAGTCQIGQKLMATITTQNWNKNYLSADFSSLTLRKFVKYLELLFKILFSGRQDGFPIV